MSEVDPTHNKVEGTVTKDGKPIYEVFGQLGHLVEMWPIDDEENKTTLFTKDEHKEDVISYPPVCYSFYFV